MTHRPTPSSFAALVLAAAVLASACGDSTAPAPTPVGDYRLVDVNATPVPSVIFRNAAGTVEATSGRVTLRADGSYRQALEVRATFFGPPQRVEVESGVEDGTYTVTGTTITFTIGSGSRAQSYTGTVDRGVLRYVSDGYAFTFQR